MNEQTMTPASRVMCPVCGKPAKLRSYMQSVRRVPRSMPVEAIYDCQDHQIRVTVASTLTARGGKTVVYVAHPLGDGEDRERNRQNAALWCAWILRNYRVAPSADWIVLSGVLEETPENRALGLDCDLELVSRCDELWLVGGRVSPGMTKEAIAAHDAGVLVRDLTWLGYGVPEVAPALSALPILTPPTEGGP